MRQDLIFDYIRLVSYSIVLLSSLRGILYRRFTNLLFVGDIVMVVSLLTTAICIHLMDGDIDYFGNYVLTPGAIIWATIHLLSLFYGEDKNRDL
jgi:hypothetical protein